MGLTETSKTFTHFLPRTSHYGLGRQLAAVNDKYRINNDRFKIVLMRVAEQCDVCNAGKSIPKALPRFPIASSRFGERVGMDLKQLLDIEYCLTVVDHFTNLTWLGCVPTKHQEGIIDFFFGEVVPDVKRIQREWDSEEGKSPQPGTSEKMFCILEQDEAATEEGTITTLSTASVGWDFFADVRHFSDVKQNSSYTEV